MTPARIWKVEVLPAPSGPIRPKISPLLTSKLIPRTASVSPYFFQRLFTWMAAPEEGGHPSPQDPQLSTAIILRAVILKTFGPARNRLRQGLRRPRAFPAWRIRWRP